MWCEDVGWSHLVLDKAQFRATGGPIMYARVLLKVAYFLTRSTFTSSGRILIHGVKNKFQIATVHTGLLLT
jgi:hypothetical protein